MKIKKAIIPAAGLGTRVLPASKSIPKEMLNIVDRPAIQYIVEEAVAAGIEDILIITNRGKGVIEDHFDHAFELEKSGYTVLCVDRRQAGIGSNSCGPRLLKQYELRDDLGFKVEFEPF